MTENLSVNIAVIIKRLLLKWSQQEQAKKAVCISAVNISFLYSSGFYSSGKGSRSFSEGYVLPCYCN